MRKRVVAAIAFACASVGFGIGSASAGHMNGTWALVHVVKGKVEVLDNSMPKEACLAVRQKGQRCVGAPKLASLLKHQPKAK